MINQYTYNESNIFFQLKYDKKNIYNPISAREMYGKSLVVPGGPWDDPGLSTFSNNPHCYTQYPCTVLSGCVKASVPQHERIIDIIKRNMCEY